MSIIAIFILALVLVSMIIYDVIKQIRRGGMS